MTETAHHCAEHSGSMQMLAQLERNINDRYDTINAEIRKLSIRVEALEGYSWLGAAFNKVRDNAIKLFLGGLLSLLVYALVHSADFADAIKMIGRF